MNNEFLQTILQGFFFRKIVPGILIGVFAYHFGASQGGDGVTFVASMTVFWAAIGVGHGLAQLTEDKITGQRS